MNEWRKILFSDETDKVISYIRDGIDVTSCFRPFGMELMLHPVLGLLKAILKANHTTVTTPLDSVF